MTARTFAALTCAAAVACVLLPLGGAAVPGADGEGVRTLVLALLYAGCEHAGRLRGLLRARHSAWRNESPEVSAVAAEQPGQGAAVPPWAPCAPVLLAGAMLLGPAAAALVPVPGTLLDPAARSPRWLRRSWNAAQLALGTAVAGAVFRVLGGPAMLAAVLPGRPPGGARVPFLELLLPAGAAACSFALLNAVLVTAMRWLDGQREAVARWRSPLAAALPAACAQGLLGLLIAVLWRGPYGVFAAVLVLLPLGVSAWVSAQYHRERAAHRATVRALVQAVEIKDEYTRGHSERVGRASVLVARQLGMAGERIASLRVAGTLHDVGKLGVPTRVLRKSGPLSPDERAAIELHPEYGHEMVRGITFLGEARAGILHHHERYDGRGYPYGLAGAAIPEFARIIAVADAFDSMTSTRSYRRGRPVPEAVAELERCAGTQFDPDMVRALVDAVRTHGWQPARPPADTAGIPDIPLGLAGPGPAAGPERTPAGSTPSELPRPARPHRPAERPPGAEPVPARARGGAAR